MAGRGGGLKLPEARSREQETAELGGEKGGGGTEPRENDSL